MCEPATIIMATSAVAGLAGAGVSAYGKYQEGKANQAANYMQAGIYENNAETGYKNASTERQIGINEARKRRIETIQRIGAQKAGMAASGMDINQGTAVDLVADTAAFGELDALTELYNSERRAINYERQADDFMSQAKLSRMSGKNAYKSGVISGLGTAATGVSQVSGKWTTYGNTGLTTAV